MNSRIATQDDLADYVREHVSSRACERAFVAGRVEVLGGFAPLLPSTSPGWAVQITSRAGRVWLFGVLAEVKAGQRYRLLELNEIAWTNWAGRRNWPPSLYEGSDPVRYARYRKEARDENPSIPGD